jgi:two-component system response regulator PilR (NtrC family)
MHKAMALIVDDEPDILELLKITLERINIKCVCVKDIESAISSAKENKFDICITDMRLPDGNGLEFVKYCQKNHSAMPIAVLTAHGNMESAIQALKSGAFDFLNKPVDLTVLRTLIKDALELSQHKTKSERNLVGQSASIEELRNIINKVSRSQAPIYISGESGTGKELVARMIHETGPRSKNPFVPVNSGAIPHELMESEFFGHKKGSFTGAVSDKQGLFQAAEGGTLFLDEIADLPQDIQVKLLRAIQEKNVRPVGSQHEIPVNVRILSATHMDLSKLVDTGNFRKDLFYRINVIEVKVPPLRERLEDLPLLTNHIINRLKKDTLNEDISISDEAIEYLKEYDFPGNIRELENVLERALTMCEGDIISVADIGVLENTEGEKRPANSNLNAENVALEEYLLDIEKEAILEVLNKAKWNRTAAAKQLGISLRALRYKLDKLNIE